MTQSKDKPKVRWYVGVKQGYHADIFKADNEPMESTHGSKYMYCYGGYPTQRIALQVAMYHNFYIDNPETIKLRGYKTLEDNELANL